MPSFDTRNPNYVYIDSSEALREVLPELKQAEVIAVDTEATGLDPYTCTSLLVQIGVPNKAFIFDARRVDLTLLKPVLEDSAKLKLLQNAKFDYNLIRVKTGISMNNMFDSMIAERLLTNGISREVSLLSIANKYLGVNLEKAVRQTFVNPKIDFSQAQLEYSALDVLVMFPIFKSQFALLQKENLTRIANLEFQLIPVVGEMEIHGSLVDRIKWESNIRELEQKRVQIAAKIQDFLRPLYLISQMDLFGAAVDVININSQPQVLDAFARLGVDIPSTGVAVLQRTDHEFAKMLLEYREYEKLISAFGFNFLEKINPKTGRIHPDYMQVGADSGRFACSNPNLQQIPKESAFRSCFTAPPGRKLITADYSQAELRILAEVSGDPVFVRAYKEDADVHTLTASQMFKVPEEKVSKELRFQAKSINFGLMYGRGGASLAAQIGVSADEGKRLLDTYFNTYKKVKKWLDKAAKEAVENGYATTLGGRKRWFVMPDKGDPNYDRLIGSIERQGKNTPIQGTSADMTKYALVYISQALKKEGLDAYPIQTVHDEIIVEAAEEAAPRVKEIMEEEMTRAHETLIKTVPAKIDAVISDLWEH